MNRIFESLAKIDRRIIYLVVFLGIAIPILSRTTFFLDVTPEVKKAFQEIESLEQGSAVLISIDYDAASMPELQPMLHAILKHLFRKNIKVIMMGHWPLGLPLGQIALEKEAENFGKVYGEDYVFLGYRPGIAAVMINMGKEIRQVFASDYWGTPLDSLPVMRDIHSYREIALLMGLEAGAVGDFWVQFAQARYNQKIILGATAVVAPDLYPYLQAGQIVGLIGGLRGAADYETLVKSEAQAFLGMAPQTITHVMVVIFILIGNIGFFALRRRK